ncbi:MAG: divalent-cation tolerance protein CutA [Verrucomicrobiaceae bacterium]
MSDVFLVLSTFSTSEQARQIGTVLLEKQLVACLNLLPGVESIYRWKGKIEKEREVLAVFKTTERKLDELEKELLELHPYDTPEFLVVKADRVGRSYLSWIQSAC